MVKQKIEQRLKEDPVSVIIVILVFVVLLAAVLMYMHVLQNQQINHLYLLVDQLEAAQASSAP